MSDERAAAIAAWRKELELTLVLARNATNGWACYAKRQIEHDEIARLHNAISEVERRLSALPATEGAGDPQTELGPLCVCGHERDWHGNDGAGHCGATKTCRGINGCKTFRAALQPVRAQEPTDDAGVLRADRRPSVCIDGPPAKPVTAAWGEVFQPCDPCVTKTHCGQHRRCLADCTPADLVPSVRETTPEPPMGRCDSRQDASGWQCGLPKGHSGAHTALIPSGYPWSSGVLDTPAPEPPSPSPDLARVQALEQACRTAFEVLREADQLIGGHSGDEESGQCDEDCFACAADAALAQLSAALEGAATKGQGE